MNSPLALYAAELGIEKGRIGMLGALMPFAQVLCIAFLPVVLAYSQRFITGAAYGSRYFFVLPWIAAPFLGSPDLAFWLLFACVTAYAILRTLAETAIYPWSQEYMPRQVRGRHIDIPPRGVTAFVPNEVLLEVESGTPAQYLNVVARRLQLTLLETQSFTLTGRTLQRWRIDGRNSVRTTLQRLSPFGRISAAQPNFLYVFGQAQPPAQSDAGAQYVVPKLHLLEAHKITNGDDVLVAVIDSKIDASHPDLAGVIADQYDALGTPAPAHMHGTGMAGAIAAHAKLIGVAPKVKLLAVRAFSGTAEGAQGTTFNILKGLDWAASKNARIVNMSFAGPADPMFRDMLAKAHARGIVLIAAVGNAGPRSPPLYPAADRDVIGVTATDADDKLLPQANRGPQVAVAAPGVQIVEPAPDAGYQLTTGTSVAAAHASGVAALLLARDPKLTPDQVRALLVKSARAIPGNKRDVGAGVIDALAAVDTIRN